MKKHLLYWLLPALLIIIYMIIYFFDLFGVSYIIAPNINREFGLLENTQLIIIIGIMIIATQGFFTSSNKFKKLIMLLAFFISVFLFLEEIDYGDHFVKYFSNEIPQKITESYKNKHFRNIHNNGKLTEYFKLTAYIIFGMLLMIYPYLLKKFKIKNPYILWFKPSGYLVYTLLVMIFINQLALFLDKHFKAAHIHALNSNVSEFEEVFIYLIMFLYLRELKNKTLLQKKTIE